VKATPIQFSFCVSIFCHAVIISLILGVGLGLHKPAFQQEDSVITLTLVAALESPPDKPMPPKPIETKSTAIPVPTKTVSQLILPQPISLPSPIVSIPSPAPSAAKPTKDTNIRGDNSSVKTGTDATTVEARPSVLAKPNYLNNPEPPYPALARQRHQEGLVLLVVKVTAQGGTDRIEIKKSSGFSLLDTAACQAVRNWKFEPARIGSLAVESEIEVPIRFKLVN